MGIKSDKKNEIALIFPYFGKFPEWIDLYLFSCSRNYFIDFIFFTDCEIPKIVYPNTFFYKISFAEYCKKVSSCLNICFAPLDPYKLCDLKPFYGLIHYDIICSYTFWGFGDIDLVYGDLTLVCNSDALRKYDILTTHTNRIAGHLTIIKRNSKYTDLCLKIEDWKNKLESQKHLSLDEDDWALLIYPELKYLRGLYHYVFRPLHIHMRYCYEGLCNKIFCNRITRRSFTEYGTTPIPKDDEQWRYDIKMGRVTNPNKKEIPYLHFLFFKKNLYHDLINFWQNDFYKVGRAWQTEKTGYVIFDNRKVIYIKEV